jgi:hypothetical protein
MLYDSLYPQTGGRLDADRKEIERGHEGGLEKRLFQAV